MSWDDVRVFLALVRTRSLVQAARSIGMDKSTASRRVAALEKAVGAKLFLRTREGLRPSPVGERMRAHAERMEGEARALESAAVAGGEEVAGVVRLATTEALAERLVQLGLLGLRDAHPALVVELLGGNRAVDLARGEADLALRVTPPGETSLKARIVARLGFALFASPTYLRARGTPRNGASLAGHDVLLPSGELAQLPEGVWLGSREGVRVVFRSSSMPALVAACVAGHGLAALTTAWGEGTPGLDRVLELEHVAARPIWLLSHPDGSKRAAVRVVADRVAELMRAAARG